MNQIDEKTFVNSMLGIPYKYGGRTRDDGMDCWGFVAYAYASLGIDLPELPHIYWPVNGYAGDMLETELMYVMWRAVTEIHTFDLLLFYNHLGVPFHTGVALRNGRSFIHCGMPGVIVTRMDDRWHEKLKKAYRYVDL